MRQLIVFNNISLDGYFTDANNDMSFAKRDVDDPEYAAFVGQNASGEGISLFGRVTYEMMASFWPTPIAEQMMPEVAESMNARPKIVFSRTLREAPWNNTTLVSDDAVEYVRRLKEQPGPDLAVLGSGQIVSQLAQAELVDEYQFVIVPVVLGKGRTLFETVTRPIALRLTQTRSFQNGSLFLSYEGVKDAAADHSVHLV
ncbi:MAG TPA: dihydrofolate reductase family protein [Candidatus Baltobacteraceae bacterium]|nr:dihydrofolate reductase family protein [Candidatus Baltobacteraceae bacterium]